MQINNMEEIEIITATAVYCTEPEDVATWYLKEIYYTFRDILDSRESVEIRIQAWQYVKAYTKLLKERLHWDSKNGRPAFGPYWMELETDSDEWLSYYTRHPEDQTDMLDCCKLRIKKERLRLCQD